MILRELSFELPSITMCSIFVLDILIEEHFLSTFQGFSPLSTGVITDIFGYFVIKLNFFFHLFFLGL